MSFEEKYEQIISGFIPNRREILNVMTNVIPTASDMHRRKWRIQQLDNAIFDIKTTFAACNNQLDKERSVLDDLTSENERLSAQERKLKEDLKLLEGVTGMPATMPCDAQTGINKEINDMAENFRNNFADFYFNLPKSKQDLPENHDFEKDGSILIATLRDYVTLRFDHRAAESAYSKLAEERSVQADKMEKDLSDRVMKIEREIESNRKEIEDEAGKTKDILQAQTMELRTQGKTLTKELFQTQENLIKRVDAAKAAKDRLTMRCQNLQTQNIAIKENLRRRSQEIELELDRLENRMEVIRRAPSVVDKRLVNIALITTEKSKKINLAVARMREEIAAFNQWLRE